MRTGRHEPLFIGLGVVVLLSLCATYAPRNVSGQVQNATTVGAITLTSTLNSIGVRAAFSGDTNANNRVVVRFQKQSGDTGYHDAYTPYTDRRATLDGTVNPYANEARVSIVGLAEDTIYSVQVTWSDPDGIIGTATVSTVRTLSSIPATGGSTVTVSGNAALAAALTSAIPGQTISLGPGTYSPFTITRSGTADAWISIEGQPGAVVSGEGINQNVAINANYVILKNLTLGPSDFSGITIAANAHDVIVQNNVLQNVSRLCSEGPTTTHLEDTGVNVGSGASHILVLRNTVTSTSLQACVQSVTYDGPGQGIGLSACTACVVSGNVVNGAFRDAITSDNSYNSLNSVDLANNRVTGFVDDGVESKGENINVRMWGNIIASNQSNTCIAGNTNTTTNRFGPLYVFRNACKITGGAPASGGMVWKGPSVPTYIFHNSIDTTGFLPRWATWALGANSGPYVLLNNAVDGSGSMLEQAPGSTISDYSVGTSGSSWAYLWNGVTTYSTFLEFVQGTGKETHGRQASPLFLDSDLHPNPTGPVVDAGVSIANFNTADSAWPARGLAPDVGAYETGGVPSAPTNVRIIR